MLAFTVSRVHRNARVLRMPYSGGSPSSLNRFSLSWASVSPSSRRLLVSRTLSGITTPQGPAVGKPPAWSRHQQAILPKLPPPFTRFPDTFLGSRVEHPLHRRYEEVVADDVIEISTPGYGMHALISC
jgi:hypothetical protein